MSLNACWQNLLQEVCPVDRGVQALSRLADASDSQSQVIWWAELTVEAGDTGSASRRSSSDENDCTSFTQLVSPKATSLVLAGPLILCRLTVVTQTRQQRTSVFLH